MTLFIADIASYQGSLTLEQLRSAGFGGINVKVSHGLGQRSVHPNAAAYVRDARAAGMALSCFHWLTGDASGVAQADYAYRRMAELGLTVPGVAVTVDVEGTASTVGGEPTGTVYRDFLSRMGALLGRPVVTYTGDWYAESRSWLRASPASPWLHSAPTAGYVPSYPGDESPMWENGYAGWAELAVMQYRVAKINGIQVSQSAVRSAELWSAMTGGVQMSAWVVVPCLLQGRSEFNKVNPNRDKGADGTVGDSNHDSKSDHTPDEDSDVLREKDSDHKNEVHALDVDSTGPWPDGKRATDSGSWFDRKVKALVEKQKALWFSATDKCWLQNVIWNGEIASLSWDWEWRDYTGSDPHTNHAHFSARYITSCEEDTRSWGVFEEDEVTEAELIAAMQKWATSADGKKALFEAVLYYLVDAPAGSNDADGKWRVLSFLTNTYPAAVSARTYSADARTAAQAALVKVTEDDGDRQAIIDAINASNSVDVAALGAAIASSLGPIEGGPSLAEIESATANALRSVFLDAASPDSSPA